jgi:hypothetical protein
MTKHQPCRSCRHRDQQALTDELLLNTIDRKPLRTDTIDQLPPWRARMIVRVCLAAGAQLQHGDPDQFDTAARAAGREDASQAGWWRRALGMPPREQLPDPPARGEYIPPAGWTVVTPAEQ